MTVSFRHDSTLHSQPPEWDKSWTERVLMWLIVSFRGRVEHWAESPGHCQQMIEISECRAANNGCIWCVFTNIISCTWASDGYSDWIGSERVLLTAIRDVYSGWVGFDGESMENKCKISDGNWLLNSHFHSKFISFIIILLQMHHVPIAESVEWLLLVKWWWWVTGLGVMATGGAIIVPKIRTK